MHNFWHSMLNCYMPKVVALSLCVDRRKIAKLNIKFSTIVETENRNAYFYIRQALFVVSVWMAKPVFVVSVLMAKHVFVVSVGLRMFQKISS